MMLVISVFMKKSILRIFDLIKEGELKFLINGISKRILSKNQAFGLKRNLDIEFQIPNAKIDIDIRHFKHGDNQFFSEDLQNHGLIEKDIPVCYVATLEDNKPCFRQWLIGSEYKDKIQEFWGQSFPVLKDDEMLLEGGFTISSMRGQGIMPAAITRIIEKEKRPDRKWIITFVGINNIRSLKGIHRSGFKPYVLRTERWFLFKRSITFKEVPKDFITTYLKNIGVF